VIDGDFVEGWDGLLLHLANDEGFDLGELPVVSKTEDCCPVFGWRIVDRVYGIIKHPKETGKVVDSHTIEDARISVRTPRSLSCAIPCELFPKHRRFAFEEMAMDTEKHVFDQKYYVATVDVVLSVPAITLERRLVHGEIRPISAFGVAGSRDAGCRL